MAKRIIERVIRVERKIPKEYFEAALVLYRAGKEVDETSLAKMVKAFDIEVDKDLLRSMTEVWNAICPVGIW